MKRKYYLIALSILIGLNAFAENDSLSDQDRHYLPPEEFHRAIENIENPDRHVETMGADIAAELARLRELVQTQQELIRAKRGMDSEQESNLSKNDKYFEGLLKITANASVAWYGTNKVKRATRALFPYFWKYVHRGEIPSWYHPRYLFVYLPKRYWAGEWGAAHSQTILNTAYGVVAFASPFVVKAIIQRVGGAPAPKIQ